MGQDKDESFGLKPATAIGYSIISNLGGERQMTVQCFVAEDEDIEVINRRIDRVLAVVDRQKAKYDLAKREQEFEEVALHTRNFLNAIPMAERAAQAQVETLKAELLGMQEARKEVHDEAYSAHVAAGRRGQFRPKGSLEGQLRNMDNEIAKKKLAIEGLPADTAQHRDQTLINIRKYQDDLKKRRGEINDLRKLAGLDNYTAFMDEETAEV
jgi:hypothetical protein